MVPAVAKVAPGTEPIVARSRVEVIVPTWKDDLLRIMTIGPVS